MSEIIIKITKDEFFEIREQVMNEVKYNSFTATKHNSKDLKAYMLNEISFYFETCVANVIADNERDNEILLENKIRVTA